MTKITVKAGRYGGTYAHKDIAFEFAMCISPQFKIYIVKLNQIAIYQISVLQQNHNRKLLK